MDDKIKTLQEQLETLQSKFTEIEEAYKDLMLRFQRVDSLFNIASSLSTIVDFTELLSYAKNLFKKSIKTDQYALMLVNKSTSRLTIKSSFGLPVDSGQVNDFPFEGTLFHDVLKRRETLYLDDIAAEEQPVLYPSVKLKSGSFLCVPLVVEDHRTLGLISLHRKADSGFTPDERMFIAKIAEQIAYTLNKVLIYEHTKELSIKDDLTGIFNRRYFNQRFEREIQRAKRYKHSLAILMLDIDNFKLYNDINGHIKGDDVLKRVSVVLERILRKTDLIARFGGEEFIIMLPEISQEQSASVADKLRQEIERTAFEGEETLPNGKITISIGISVFPEDSREPQKLIQYADEALYLAKSSGRNCVIWHGMRPPLAAETNRTSPHKKHLKKSSTLS